MCIVYRRYREISTVQEDIECYRVHVFTRGQEYSLYYNKLLSVDEVLESELQPLEKESEDGYYLTGKGMYAYASIEGAMAAIDGIWYSHPIILETFDKIFVYRCVIPKGTKFYDSSREYCSERVKCVELQYSFSRERLKELRCHLFDELGFSRSISMYGDVSRFWKTADKDITVNVKKIEHLKGKEESDMQLFRICKDWHTVCGGYLLTVRDPKLPKLCHPDYSTITIPKGTRIMVDCEGTPVMTDKYIKVKETIGDGEK